MRDGKCSSSIGSISCVKLAFHDADTDTDTNILARILGDTSDTRDFLELFLWQAERHADILTTILARMSVSVSVSASWNASLTIRNKLTAESTMRWSSRPVTDARAFACSVLRASHVAAVCESVLTSRQTLLTVDGVDEDALAAADGDMEDAERRRRRCGTTARPWTITTARHGQRINVSVVDLSAHPDTDADHAGAAAAAVDDDGDAISSPDDRCRRRFAHFTEQEALSVSREHGCDEDGVRRVAAPLVEAPLYSSRGGRVRMVLDSRRTTAADKYLLIFTGR